MIPVKTAVIGVGIQGQRHAEKFDALPASQLVAVVDIDSEHVAAVASELGVGVAQDYHDLIGEVSAVVVATPTLTHFDIVRTFLENRIHVLVEKPIATTMEEADELVELAEAKGLVLQVGHQERYNPVVVALAQHLVQPQFIESNRIAPYKPRALDVSVVLDLMIHDIDLIHSFVQSPMEQVDAVGRSVFSKNIDVSNARIRFANGCVANVTSSRISMKTERTLRVFQANSYLSADLHNKTLSVYSKRGPGPVSGPEDVAMDKRRFGSSDAMMEQAKAFIGSVTGGSAPLVSGRNALRALETATVIGDLVERQRAI